MVPKVLDGSVKQFSWWCCNGDEEVVQDSTVCHDLGAHEHKVVVLGPAVPREGGRSPFQALDMAVTTLAAMTSSFPTAGDPPFETR
eukprot:CAMPEP_0171964194 /NCGR_PEP_ID=MMETSP0993-20121228/179929_1 /TAXON_ID=483369 /ORGANISM="non described non described, Strain CCMP2098" /LENGTH=85 /DNA_ID=CAMNT_0012612977 /DNA_START=229 /DNA_END=483 /DNA_ORIENTATION=-